MRIPMALGQLISCGHLLIIAITLMASTSVGQRSPSRPPLPRCCFLKRDSGLKNARPFTLVVPLELSPSSSTANTASVAAPSQQKKQRITTTTTTTRKPNKKRPTTPKPVKTTTAQPDITTFESSASEDSTINRPRKNIIRVPTTPAAQPSELAAVTNINSLGLLDSEISNSSRVSLNETFPPRSFHILGWLLKNAKPWTSDGKIEHYPSVALNSSFLANKPDRMDDNIYDEYPKSNTTRRHLELSQFARRSPFYFSAVETPSGRVTRVRYQGVHNRTRRQTRSLPQLPPDWQLHLKRTAFHSLSGSPSISTVSPVSSRLWTQLSRAQLGPDVRGKTPDMVAGGLLFRTPQGGFKFGPVPAPRDKVPPGWCPCEADAVAYWAVRMFKMVAHQPGDHFQEPGHEEDPPEHIYALVYLVYPLGQETAESSPAAFGYLPHQLQSDTLQDVSSHQYAGTQPTPAAFPPSASLTPPLRTSTVTLTVPTSPLSTSTAQNNFKGVLIEGPSGYTEDFVTLYRHVVEDHFNNIANRLRRPGRPATTHHRFQIPPHWQRPYTLSQFPYVPEETRMRVPTRRRRPYLQLRGQTDLFVARRPPFPNHPYVGIS